MIRVSLLARTLCLCRRSICSSLLKFSSTKCVRSSLPDIEISNDNFAEYIMKDFGKWPDNVALQCSVTGKKYKYEDLRIKSQNLSKSLGTVLNLKTGDIVAVLLPNSPQFVVSALGVLLSGLRLTTINPIYTADEIQRQLIDSNAKAIITFSELIATVQKALENMTYKIPIISTTATQAESLPRGIVKYEELIDIKDDSSRMNLLDQNDFMFLPYSSGTTGLPKGVMLSNTNLTANIAQYHAFGYIKEASANMQDILPVVLPMFHVYGFVLCMAAVLQKGAKLVTLPRFSPNLFLQVLKEYRPTVLKVAPPLVLFLNSHPDVKPEDLKSIRTLVCGAAPLGKTDEDRFRAKANTPVNMVQGYGLTEGGPLVSLTQLSNEGKFAATMGELVPNTLAKVVNINDQRNAHLNTKQIGELLLKGPQIMLGYYNKPEETQITFTEDGWLRTGDMVWYDERGMFYITDRLKELIKVKGFQVAPAELEEIIRSFPGVAEAAVIGISDKYSGEIPRAYVVPKERDDIDVKKLRKFVDDKVATYKKLAGGVMVVSEIPKKSFR